MSTQAGIAIDPRNGAMLFACLDGISDEAAAGLRKTIEWYASHTAYPIFVIARDPATIPTAQERFAKTLVVSKDNRLAASLPRDFVNQPIAACFTAGPATKDSIAALGRLLGLDERRFEFIVDAEPSYTQLLEQFVKLRDRLRLVPQVSVLVPAYNHEDFIIARLKSITDQSFQDFELIVLDDCSSDATVKVIRDQFSDPRLRLIENRENSGSPFRQWQKGLRLAAAPFVWIAEGDDFCTENLLAELLALLRRPGFVMAYAKTDITDRAGVVEAGALDDYLARANSKKFRANYDRGGAEEVEECFARLNPAVNASALVFRKSAIDGDVLERATSHKVCGDWLIYLSMLRSGSIAYCTNATNYFRRHNESAYHKAQGTPEYFKERFEIAEYVVNNFSISKQSLDQVFAEVEHVWNWFKSRNKNAELVDFFDKTKLRATWVSLRPDSAENLIPDNPPPESTHRLRPMSDTILEKLSQIEADLRAVREEIAAMTFRAEPKKHGAIRMDALTEITPASWKNWFSAITLAEPVEIMPYHDLLPDLFVGYPRGGRCPARIQQLPAKPDGDEERNSVEFWLEAPVSWITVEFRIPQEIIEAHEKFYFAWTSTLNTSQRVQMNLFECDEDGEEYRTTIIEHVVPAMRWPDIRLIQLERRKNLRLFKVWFAFSPDDFESISIEDARLFIEKSVVPVAASEPVSVAETQPAEVVPETVVVAEAASEKTLATPKKGKKK
jgi:glycosyltransferase involved in cell wall biosynthesis